MLRSSKQTKKYMIGWRVWNKKKQPRVHALIQNKTHKSNIQTYDFPMDFANGK